MKRNHLKAIVWPRQEAGSKGPFKYAIVGVLITDTEIESLRGKPMAPDATDPYGEKMVEWPCSEFMLDGEAFGIEDLLDLIRKRAPAYNAGDAVNVLCSLDDL